MQIDLFDDLEPEDNRPALVPVDKVLYKHLRYDYQYFIDHFLFAIDRDNSAQTAGIEPGRDVTEAYHRYLENRKIQFNYNWQHPEVVANQLNITTCQVLELYEDDMLIEYMAWQNKRADRRGILHESGTDFTDLLRDKVDIFRFFEDRHVHYDEEAEETLAIMASPYISQDLFLYKMPRPGSEI